MLYAEGGSYEALSGLLLSYFRKGDYGALTRLYDSVTTHDPVPRRYLVLGILAGDAAWASGDIARAESLYAQVRAGDISPGLTESAFVRRWALSDSLTAFRFLPYIVGEMSDTARIGWLGMMAGTLPDPLRDYVRGRLLLRMGWYNEAAYTLLQVGTIAADSAVEALRQRSIGDALLRAGRTEEARAWYWTSMNYDARPYVQEIVYDRLEYCDWLGTHPPTLRSR
jgi:tetratricopeptide (TPR) repeat protein